MTNHKNPQVHNNSDYILNDFSLKSFTGDRMLPHSKVSTSSLMASDALPSQITTFFLVQSCLKLAKKRRRTI